MAYKVNFNGVDLDKYCRVISVSRSILPPRTNNSKTVPRAMGSYYTGFKYGERTINCEIYIKHTSQQELRRKISKLADVLNTNSPRKMVVSDEPDKYVYAILDGSTNLDNLVNASSTTLSFVCHNPTIYSNKWSTFVPNQRGVTNILNEANNYTYPVIDVIFKNKACFFQATNQNGDTVLVGTPKELNKPIVPESDIVIEDDCNSSSTFTTLSSSLLPNDHTTEGANFGVGREGNAIIATNYGSGDKWHGAAFRRNLDSETGDLDDFEVTVDFTFSAQGKNYEPPKPEPLPPSEGSGTSLGRFRVANCGGLWINKEPNTNNRLFAMSPGTIIYPTEIQGNWYKHTHKGKYDTYTGWSYGKYLEKINDTTYRVREEEFAEEQVGMLEVFGYDKGGANLFRSCINDQSEWFESNAVFTMVGGDTILREDSVAGAVRQVTVGEGENTTQENAASGAVGRWNDCVGKFIIRRETNSNGQQLWSATINKYVNGSLVTSITTQNLLSSSSYPKGKLNNIGFFIGGFDKNETMSVASIDHIKVRKLNIKTDENIASNISLFNPNDEMQINFESGEVTLNGISIIERVDIGSNFFEVPSGDSRIIARSDDKDIIVCSGIQHRYI